MQGKKFVNLRGNVRFCVAAIVHLSAPLKFCWWHLFLFTLLKNIESFEITDNYRDYDIRYIVLSLVVPDLI